MKSLWDIENLQYVPSDWPVGIQTTTDMPRAVKTSEGSKFSPQADPEAVKDEAVN